MSVRRFDASAEGFAAAFAKFLQLRRGVGTEDVHAATNVIVRDVRERGGEAVAAYTKRFDGVALDPVTITAKGIDLFEAAERCKPEVREALDFAAKRIEAYHAEQKPSDHILKEDGIELGWRWTPVDAVGLYVPGGRASYPSSVLMNAIPARAAGVKRIAMTSPVPGGELNPAVAYAAVRAGVSEFYPIGGAQAVAAFAYGAGNLKPVDKIVGPGNAYVAAAKRIVFGDVGIDTIAGPSEITVVADAENKPEWIAADLLSQSEHDPLAQSILITPDAKWADLVEAVAEQQIPALATAATTGKAWKEYAAIVIAPLSQAAEIVNQIAPEHVELAVTDPDAIAKDVRHSGAIFFGRWAPEALGDYVTGSNHVLPTSGAARFASGLSVLDFLKRTSLQRISESGFHRLARAAEALAECEGLPAHKLSITIRGGG